jgi:hypothetical protein
MVDRLRYFQQAHNDIAYLRTAFYEAYLESRALYPKVERLTDGRITVFAKCFNVSMSAEIGLALHVSQVLDIENFKKLLPAGELRVKDKRHIQDEFQQFLKMSMANAFFASLDSSFRTFVKVADPKFTTIDDNFTNLYRHTLKELNLKEHLPALDLFRLIRNTFHTNGYHNAKNQTVKYNGKTYEFIRGKTINISTWSFFAVLLYDIRQMLLAVIKSKPFTEAARVDDPFLGFEWPATPD